MSLSSPPLERTSAPTSPALPGDELAILRVSLQGSILTPEEDGFQDAVRTWALGVQHAPALVVLPESAEDIATAITFAHEHGFGVAVQGTGHGATIPCHGGILINTSRMQGVTIDPEARTARVEAGVKWISVLPLAAEHGLAPLCGSSGDVGVVGYTLGGGTGWLARKYGFAADRVIAADVVTATGEIVHVTANEHADLFWALRGGSGNFGVVTALEFELVPVETVFGGAVFYSLTGAAQVMTAFVEWVETLPEEITASVAIMRFPPLPFLPPMLRGQQVIAIRACAVGDLARAEQVLAPMRSLGTPVLDTFRVMPFSAIDTISSDPVEPMPVVSATRLIRDLPADAIAQLLAVAGPESDLPVLMIEIRHIAGAIDRHDRAASSANRHDEPFSLYAVGIAMGEDHRSTVLAGLDRVTSSLAPYSSERVFLNFLGDGDCGEERTRAAYSSADYARLGQIKALYDPTNRFRFNCNIAPAG